jgi:hypothetical protein
VVVQAAFGTPGHTTPLLFPPTRSTQPLLARAAHQVDRAAIALDARPQLRAALALYLVVLHVLVVL